MLLRSTNGLTPTEAGRNFYDRAKRSIEEGEAAELAARGTAAALSGRLRICAPLTFTACTSCRACRSFSPSFPAGGQASAKARPFASFQGRHLQPTQQQVDSLIDDRAASGVAVSSRRSITSTTRLCADRSRSAQSMMRTTYEAFDVREPSLEAGETR